MISACQHDAPPDNCGFPAGAQWYVVHCQPLRERYAALNLGQRLGLTVYLPEVRRFYGGRVEEAPLFPRYLFVQADLQVVAVSQINTIEGVNRLVDFGGQPVPVTQKVIGALYAQVEVLNVNGGLPEHGLQYGEPLRIVDGPLAGMEAIFVGPLSPSARVRVLIEFLGRLQNVELGIDEIASLDEPHPPRSRRRTRGKGRRIRGSDSTVAPRAQFLETGR